MVKPNTGGKVDSKRDAKIKKLRLNGWTYQAIADELGISHQRVQQIKNRLGLDDSAHGKGLRRKQSLEAKERLELAHIAKWGMTHGQRMKQIGDPKHNKKIKLLSAAKSNARRKNLPFNLVYEDICTPTRCPALGIRLNYNATEKRGPNSPSLDRIVPKKGYVRGNIIVVSWRANRIKCDATAKELEKIAKFYNSL